MEGSGLEHVYCEGGMVSGENKRRGKTDGMESESAMLLWNWMGIVSSRWQWAALQQCFMVLKECHAQELLNLCCVH